MKSARLALCAVLAAVALAACEEKMDAPVADACELTSLLDRNF